MRNLAILSVFLLVISIIGGVSKSISKAETYRETNTQTKTGTQKEPEIKPDPMRSICAYMWNGYYQKERVEIRVSTRGKYNETVVFTCPNCSLEDHFVNPFLNTEYQGKTGMDRIKECGFTQVIFKGGRGIEEIVRQVPQLVRTP